MIDLAYKESLTQTGLDKNQALVYETLVKMGPQPASTTARHAGIGRPLAYKVLDELITLGLAEKEDKPGKVARFTAAHPLKLKEVVEKRLAQAQGAQAALEGVLGKLTSDFNLQSGKPGVQFYEGREGVLKLLWDSLNTTEEIYAYTDPATILRFAAKENEEYVKERIKRKITKKILMPDTPVTRSRIGDERPLTEVRLLPGKSSQEFNVAIEIYNGTVSYFTFSDQFATGTLVRDPSIYAMHRHLFESSWSTALTAEELKQQAADSSRPQVSQ